MSYESFCRPCHSIWSAANPEQLKKAILSVDPTAIFEDGTVGYSYPYNEENLIGMVAELSDTPNGLNNHTAIKHLRIDIKDITARMRDFDDNGFIDCMGDDVKSIMKLALVSYILEERPELKPMFPSLDFDEFREDDENE